MATPQRFTVDQIIDALRKGGSEEKAGQLLGANRWAIYRTVSRLEREGKLPADILQRRQANRRLPGKVGPTLEPESTAGDGEGLSQTTSDGGMEKAIVLKSRTIKTLEGALKESETDTRIWQVDRSQINKWNGYSKNDKTGKMELVELWQVKVWLKRKAPQYVTEGIAELYETYKKWRPIVVSQTQHPINKRPHMLELSLFDAHLGKLCWGDETGHNYDVDIAARMFCNAIQDLLQRVQGYKIEKILLPIGNDFFHVDNWIGTTASGTRLDVDTRFARIYQTGKKAVIGAIESCAAIAPTKVLWVPGNHDRATSYYLVDSVYSWFRNEKRVSVDDSPKARKYERYGCNLIGFTHGNEERHADLPTIMAGEAPELWAKTEVHQWHIGHFHKKKETRFSAGDTHTGVGVIVLPSLSGTDAWHFEKGYVKTNRAAEAYLWSLTDGYVGHFSANARA